MQLLNNSSKILLYKINTYLYLSKYLENLKRNQNDLL